MRLNGKITIHFEFDFDWRFSIFHLHSIFEFEGVLVGFVKVKMKVGFLP